jgi:hypothetical protein
MWIAIAIGIWLAATWAFWRWIVIYAFERGVAKGRKQVPSSFTLGDNAAHSVLEAAPDLDAIALVGCKIVSSTEDDKGNVQRELHMNPCFSIRGGETEPCLLEVARALRFLADRLEARVQEAGISRSDISWEEEKPLPNKNQLD